MGLYILNGISLHYGYPLIKYDQLEKFPHPVGGNWNLCCCVAVVILAHCIL